MPEPRLNSLLTTALEGGKLFKIRQIRPCKTRSNRMSVVESRVYVSSHGGSFPGGTGSKEPACQCRRCERHRFDPWVRKLPGGGHGDPLQFSCLENPKDRGAWRATAHQIMSQTQPKGLSIHTCMHAVSGVPFCYKPTKIEDMKAEITKHIRSFSKDLKVLRKLSFGGEGMSQVRMD